MCCNASVILSLFLGQRMACKSAGNLTGHQPWECCQVEVGTTCHTTDDGAYLIPDEVFVIPQKVSDVEMNSEIIFSWQNKTSSTARSINADASFLPFLNAKFSNDNQRMKSHQVKESAVTARIEVSMQLYISGTDCNERH